MKLSRSMAKSPRDSLHNPASPATPDSVHVEPQPPSPWLSLPAAVAGEGRAEIAPAHYGRPVQEQRMLEAGAAVVDLGAWSVLSVRGADRLSWLHSLTTQHLTSLQAGISTETLVLDPHGRVEFAACVIDDGERTWLLHETGQENPSALASFLDSMRFAMRVEVTAHNNLRVLGTVDPADGEAAPTAAASAVCASLATAPAWRDPWPETAEGSTSYGPIAAEHPGGAARRVLHAVDYGVLDELSQAMARAGVAHAGLLAWEAHRIAAWRPQVSSEVDDRALPHELDWLRTGVHLEKGCYRGQETVARVVNLGRPPRRLVQLHFDGSEERLPAPGTPVKLGEREVGRVTSVARHGEDGPIGLALVRRALDPEAVVTVDGLPATQDPVVDPSGEPANRPAQPDRSGLRRRNLT